MASYAVGVGSRTTGTTEGRPIILFVVVVNVYDETHVAGLLVYYQITDLHLSPSMMWGRRSIRCNT